MAQSKTRIKVLFYLLLSAFLISGLTLPLYAVEENEGTLFTQENRENGEDFGQAGLERQEDAVPQGSAVEESSSIFEEEDSSEIESAQLEIFSLNEQPVSSEEEALTSFTVVNEEALLTAIAVREPVIELAASFDITRPIVIDSGYKLVIKSNEAGPYVLTRAFTTGSLFSVRGSSTLTLDQVVLDGQNMLSSGSLVEAFGQSVIELNAGTILRNNDTSLHGGGIFANGGSVVTLNQGSLIENNTASVDSRDGGLGGGIYIGRDASKLFMNGGVITGNTCVKSGGGIAFATGSEGYITGGEISKNGAPKGFGGGLSIGGSVEFSGASLSQNYAYGGGGGVFNSKKFAMTGGTISGNYLTSARGDGGGIWAELAANTILLGGVIGGDDPSDANKANSGGGLYVEGYQPGSLEARTVISGDVVIKGNEATYIGGGVLVAYPDGGLGEDLRSTEISGNAQIVNNTAQHAAGVYIVLYSKYGSVDVTLSGNALIANNHATGQGGGLYFGGVEAEITDSFTISGNTAQYGGGIRLIKSSSYPTTSLTLKDEVLVEGNTAVLGGGVCVTGGATLEAAVSASIRGNIAGTGAGLYVMGSTATLGGRASVSNNNATLTEDDKNTAGAAYVIGNNIGTPEEPVYEPGVLNIGENAIISENTAGEETGGVHLDVGAIMNVSGLATITGNQKVGNASGIALNKDAVLNVWGSPRIGTSTADNGIYLASGMTVTIPADQIIEDAHMHFDGFEDTAAEGTLVALREDGSQEAVDESVCMFCSPGGFVVVEDEEDTSRYILKEATYTVTYNGNGAESGEVPLDATLYKQGETITLLENSGSLAIEGMKFLGWGLSSGHEGKPLQSGDTIEMGDDHITIYALWDLEDRIGPTDPDPDPRPDPDPADPSDLDDRFGSPGQNTRTNTVTSGTNNGTNGGNDNTPLGLLKTADSVPYLMVALMALIAGITTLTSLRKRS